MIKVFKNEFNRLIKMPLVFLMLIVLLAATFLSLILYSPVQRPSDNLDFGNDSSTQIYSTFINENKISYDDKINQAQTLLNYYSKLHDRSENTTLSLQNTLNSFELLKSEIPNGDSTVLYDKYQDFAQSVMEFKLSLINFAEIDVIEYINFIATSPEYLGSLEDIDVLLDKIDNYNSSFLNKAEAANALVNFFEANLFQEKLTKLNKFSLNFLETTMDKIIYDIKIDYNTYTEYLKTSEIFFNTSYANAWRVSLLNKISRFADLFYSVVNPTYLTIYTRNDLILDLNTAIINAHAYINLTGTQLNSYSAHKLAVEKIRGTNFINYLEQFSHDYILVQPSKEAIESIQSLINSKLQENIDVIFAYIVNFQNDPQSQLIVNKIENYKELSTMAYDLVLYTAILNTHKDLTNININDCYGYSLKNFNEYETQSMATLYNYLIKNNEYSSNYVSAPQFNFVENSPSVVDYAFFALRVAAIIIVIILVVVATIIYPLDTKKGTMNLLLVRPHSRTQIFFGKYLATLLLGCVLFMFSFIFVLSYSAFTNISYFSSIIITVFNATTILRIQPIIALLIYSISLLIEIAFLLAIIFLVAVVFKKSRISFVVSGVVLAILFSFNLITTSNLIFAFFPHTNINLYKYFLVNSSFEREHFLFKLLHSPVITNMNIWLSIIVYVAYISTLFVISNAILKSRDY